MPRIFAVDFGTSNTYVSVSEILEEISSASHVKATYLPVLQSAKGIPTVLLRTTNPAHPELQENSGNLHGFVGTIAINEFNLASPDEKRRWDYHFCSHFKPDLVNCPDKVNNPEAFSNAVLFLHEIRKGLNRFQFNPASDKVILGVPSSASEKYREILKEAAENAGFSSAAAMETIDEPEGALFSALRSGLYPLNVLMAGVLMVDFGGGTCDFAFLKEGKIRHSWGDNYYGGRLFDDLFYQWTASMHPDVMREKERIGEDFYVRTILCQTLKEDFSRYMDTNRAGNFRCVLPEVGPIRGMSWEEFLEKGRHYSLSASFQRQIFESGADIPLMYRSECDLFARFEEVLMKGLYEGGISRKDIRLVILTGGSSSWPFVNEICMKALNLLPGNLSLDPEPYAAVSKGLAVYPAMCRKFQKISETVTLNLPAFLEECRTDLNTCILQGNEELCAVLQSHLLVEQIFPLIYDFRSRGGYVGTLKRDIAHVISGFEPVLKLRVEEIYTRKFTSYFAAAWNKTNSWLKANGLNVEPPEEKPGVNYSGPEIPGVDPEIIPSILAVITLLVSFISGMIAASICGGAGMALLAAGPLGLFLGFILGSVTTFITLAGYGDYAREWVENNVKLPAFLLAGVLRDSEIEKLKKQFYEQTLAEVSKSLPDIESQVLPHVQNFVQHEIARISPLNIKCTVEE